MALTIYGIPACDTMKKARAWLEKRALAYDFHDYKKAGASHELLARWADEVGWERLLNRTGRTFRALAPGEVQDLDSARALALMSAHPSMIKRPVLEGAGPLLVGFKEELYARAFEKRG